MNPPPNEPSGSVDASCAALHQLGWSCGDLAFDVRERPVWQVFAHKGEQKIVTRAASQADAWWAAVDQALKLPLS
jgi:hypothetical protein